MNISFNGNAFDGINNYIFNKKHLNINQNIIAEGAKFEGLWSEAIVVFDPKKNSTKPSDNWVSPNNITYQPNITVFYKYFSLYVTNYTIRTRTDTNAVVSLPVSWKFEGSYNKIDWYELHSIKNTDDLIKDFRYHTYECKSIGAFQYFRFTMTDKNINELWHFHVSKIEFFGILYTKQNPFIKQSCKDQFQYLKTNLILIQLLIIK